MSPRQRVLAALRGERVTPTPAGAVTQSATVAQMDALGCRWPEAHRDPALMSGLADGARSILGFELVRVPFDQTIEAELLGAGVAYGDKTSNCTVRTHPFDLQQPLPPMPDLYCGRAQAVVDAIAMLRRKAGDGAAVIGGIVGPFTLACQMAGLSDVLMTSVRKPEDVRPWIEFAAEVGVRYARRQVEAGADAICVEDMSASLDITSPRIYRDLVLPAQQRLLAAIEAPVILHICGCNTRILDLLVQAGADALSLEAKTDLARAVSLGACAVTGGVDPVQVLLNGTAESVRAAARESLSAGVHILAPGCGLPPGVPTENLREMACAAREWRV